MLYRQISLFAKIRNQMPKAPIQISLSKISVRNFSQNFGKIGDYQLLQNNGPRRWRLWPDRIGQRSNYHVLPTTSGSRRSLHFTSSRYASFKAKMKRIKQEVKQYGVLWFVIYWSTFVPLFLVFTIPYHLGWDIIGVADYLQVHGWLEWLKWLGVDGRSLIDRCRAGDNFVLFESFWFRKREIQKMIQLNFFARRSADWRSGTDSDASSDQYGSTPSLDSSGDHPVRKELDAVQLENLEKMKEMDRPLNSTWDVYYLRNDVGANWDDRLVKVASFGTILEFWAVYLYLKLPNQLAAGCDYMIFRDGIKPEWTDPNNQNGGRWLIEIDRKQRNEQLNDKWLETLLAVIGEQLEPEDAEGNQPEICGAMVQSRRRVDRVGLWTRNADNDTVVMGIGEKYSSKIKPQWSQRLRYQSHKSTQDRTGSYQNFQFEI